MNIFEITDIMKIIVEYMEYPVMKVDKKLLKDEKQYELQADPMVLSYIHKIPRKLWRTEYLAESPDPNIVLFIKENFHEKKFSKSGFDKSIHVMKFIEHGMLDEKTDYIYENPLIGDLIYKADLKDRLDIRYLCMNPVAVDILAPLFRRWLELSKYTDKLFEELPTYPEFSVKEYDDILAEMYDGGCDYPEKVMATRYTGKMHRYPEYVEFSKIVDEWWFLEDALAPGFLCAVPTAVDLICEIAEVRPDMISYDRIMKNPVFDTKYGYYDIKNFTREGKLRTLFDLSRWPVKALERKSSFRISRSKTAKKYKNIIAEIRKHLQ